MLMPFDPSEHRHRFAAWAAGRAASVKGQRFSVQSARSAIELAGVREFGSNPPPDIDVGEFDRRHDQWRIDIAGALNVRHGVAAKLINIYLKALFL